MGRIEDVLEFCDDESAALIRDLRDEADAIRDTVNLNAEVIALMASDMEVDRVLLEDLRVSVGHYRAALEQIADMTCDNPTAPSVAADALKRRDRHA